MDSVIPFPPALDLSSERDLEEVDAAIALVAQGHARRVRLIGLADPEAVAALGLAHAQIAGVDFRLDTSAHAVAVTLGPRE
jgi:hypothetical protein